MHNLTTQSEVYEGKGVEKKSFGTAFMNYKQPEIRSGNNGALPLFAHFFHQEPGRNYPLSMLYLDY